MAIEFDWDDSNRSHLARHGVGSEEFEQVLDYPRVEVRQRRNNEDRVWCLGRTASGRLLTVVYTERRGLVRAVTAHTTKRKHRRVYEEAIQKQN